MTKNQLRAAFEEFGLGSGDAVFLHSSLSSIGHVDGGASTVVQALLSVLTEKGTLAAPAFTFGNKVTTLDLAHDRSGMGRISEEVRTLPGARRSAHLYHSVAAVGPNAVELTRVHGPSAWAADGPFWKLCELDFYILMLGLSYVTCTLFHLIEQMVQVPYRRWIQRDGALREPDGVERPLPTQAFVPESGFPGNDFNKLGRILEERGLVRIAPVGNAMARLFKAEAAVRLGIEEYRRDPLLFLKKGANVSPLEGGIRVGEEKSVVDPSAIFRRSARGRSC